MTITPPLDLAAVWSQHVARVLTDSEEDGRNPRKLSASDLHSCDFALYERLRGEPIIPRTMATFSAFERGHAYEERVWEALSAFIRSKGPNYPYAVERAPQTFLDGISGHPDFLLIERATGKVVAVIDPTTTASKFAEWKYGHALKSASYAQALECDLFCEWVISIGFGGNILDMKAHWFHLDDHPGLEGYVGDHQFDIQDTWRERVDAHVEHVQKVAALTAPPEPQPPWDPLDKERETWRCDKYCDTYCKFNKKLTPMGEKAS